jgi:hypothetical protein
MFRLLFCEVNSDVVDQMEFKEASSVAKVVLYQYNHRKWLPNSDAELYHHTEFEWLCLLFSW